MSEVFNFYILTIEDMDNIDREKLFEILNQAPDWQKLMTGVYIIKSVKNLDIWKERLNVVTKPQNISFFLVSIDIKNRNGLLNDKKWKWFKETKKDIED